METNIRQQFIQSIHCEAAHSYWARDASSWADQSIEQLLQAVDSSHFALDDWLRALIKMEAWLQQENRSLKRADRVAYIECAASVTDHLSDLATTVEEFLASYGCDQSSPLPP